MIKMMKFLFYFLPFIFGILVFIFVQKNPEVAVEKTENVVAKENSEANSQDIINNFIKSNKFAIDEDGISKTLIKKDGKIYSISQMSETQKLLVKLIAINKVKNKLSYFVSENKIDVDKNQEVHNFSKNIQNEIDKTKDMLYKIFQSNLHPLDKDFLEAIK
jgi:hypothetical protein